MSGVKIILEGIDGAGKSTFAKEIIEANPDKDFQIVHFSRDTENNLESFVDYLFSDGNIIFDRFYVGQFVYQTAKEREDKNWLSLSDLQIIESTIKGINTVSPGSVLTFYIKNDISKCLYNCRHNGKDGHYTREYLLRLEAGYEFFFRNISSIKYKIKYTEYEGNFVDYKSFDYKSLPEVVAVDFDGTLVSEAFPGIGKLNKRLVDELFNGKYKDYKKVLFTNRQGKPLREALDFLRDNNLHFDAVNEDIPEIVESLYRYPDTHRKIWFDVLFDDKAADLSKYIDKERKE